MREQNGIAAIATTIIVLALVTIITLTTAHVIATDERIYRNVFNTEQAKNAAHAGFDYALGYLNRRLYLNVTDGKVFSATLPNNAAYNVVYTFVTAGTDTDLIQIKSTGTSADGGSTRFVQAIVKPYLLAPIVTLPVTAVGGVSSAPSASTVVVFNNDGNSNLTMGGVLNMSKTASTNVSGVKTTWGSITNGVPSSGAGKGVVGTDVTQNVSALSGMSSADVQTQYLGQQVASLVNFANLNQNVGTGWGIYLGAGAVTPGNVIHFTATGTGNFSVLLGILPDIGVSKPVALMYSNPTGKLIISRDGAVVHWYGNIIANGALELSGNIEIHGSVVATNGVTLTSTTPGYPIVHGGVISGGNTSINYGSIEYDKNALHNSAFKQYGIISGSWKDF